METIKVNNVLAVISQNICNKLRHRPELEHGSFLIHPLVLLQLLYYSLELHFSRWTLWLCVGHLQNPLPLFQILHHIQMKGQVCYYSTTFNISRPYAIKMCDFGLLNTVGGYGLSLMLVVISDFYNQHNMMASFYN